MVSNPATSNYGWIDAGALAQPKRQVLASPNRLIRCSVPHSSALAA
jgi:hypothetical protein